MLGLFIVILLTVVIVVATKKGRNTTNDANTNYALDGGSKRPVDPVNTSVEYFRNKYRRMERDGKKIDWWEFKQSVEKAWPYPVATEKETDKISSFSSQALRGNANSIIELLSAYSIGLFENSNNPEISIYRDEDKVRYWKDVIVQGAAQGNRSFQAALICNRSRTESWLNDEQYRFFKEQYEELLLSDAEAGVPEAMYAVANFCLGDAIYRSTRRHWLAEKAMNAGVGDAAYLCEEIYRLDCYQKTKNGEPDPYEYSEKIRFFLKGVACNNGTMLGVMQDVVANAYRDGDAGLPKDVNKAVYYYRLAVQNGYEMAESSLHAIEVPIA